MAGAPHNSIEEYIASLPRRERALIWLYGVWLSVQIRVWRLTHRRGKRQHSDDAGAVAAARCLDCGATEGVKWLATVEGMIPLCPAHVGAVAAFYEQLESEA